MIFKHEHIVKLIFNDDCEPAGYAGLLMQIVDVYNQGERIMSKISDFVEQQDEYNSKMESTLANIRKDIEKLNSTIEKLQNSQGEISAEDQALLDKAQAKSKALVDQMNALDELTPPDTTEVPEVPEVPGMNEEE